ncbi:hypothetical protein KJ059_16830 [Myxococcota bacterium]|nr:hypothetical protein [Myxococcota bacterium]MCZ7620327.1 hypothetical protein [Myxococcota bacterium]
MTDSLLIEYLRPDGEPLLLTDLGFESLEALGIPLVQANRPFRVAAEGKTSKKGNTFFDYEQGKLSLADGLETRLRVGGVELVFGPEQPSQKGNPTRKATTIVLVGDLDYEVTAYLTKTRDRFFVKVHAHKATGKRSAANSTPISGGRII